jgi:septum formation protein
MVVVEGGHAESEPGLVLASTSSYRRSLLQRLGVPFRCRSPLCDEAALQRRSAGLEPRRLAETLALAKASSLLDDEPRSTIIGCDQLVSLGGRVFGKPGSAERAVDQLRSLSGQTHELITALVVVRGPDIFRHTDVTRLRMRPLACEAIERYVAADGPFDCAGSYKLESRGIVLFDRIESEDQSAITGLPLIALTTILSDLGFPVP